MMIFIRAYEPVKERWLEYSGNFPSRGKALEALLDLADSRESNGA